MRVFDSSDFREGNTSPPKKELQLGAGTLTSGALCFSDTYLLGGSAKSSPSVVKLWSLDDLDKEHERVIEFQSPVQALAVAPGEVSFAVGTEDGAVRIYSGMLDKLPWLLKPPDTPDDTEKKGAVSSLVYSPVASTVGAGQEALFVVQF